jgi:anti-sigma B factor antagonist
MMRWRGRKSSGFAGGRVFGMGPCFVENDDGEGERSMRVTLRSIADGGVVGVEGTLTCLEPGDPLEQAVDQLARRGPRIVVADLRHVRDMDAAGLGALVSACRASHRHYVPFRLVHVPRHIRRLIVVTGLAPVMEMFDSLVEALDIPLPRVRSAEALALRSGTAKAAPYVRDLSSVS